MDIRATEQQSFKGLGWKVILPVAIGIGVVAWLFRREFSVEVWQSSPRRSASTFHSSL